MSLSKEQIAAHVEELRLEGQECTGYTDGVLAALVFIIFGVPGIKIADLAGFEGSDLWKLAVIAHHKHPQVIETLPPVIRLSRGERFAVTHGLRKQRPELPTATDILGLVQGIYGDAMFRCLYAITYPLAPRMAEQCSATS